MKETETQLYNYHFSNLKIWLKNEWVYLLTLFLLIIFAYTNSLGNEFVSDDIEAIAKNPNIGNLSNIFSAPIGSIRQFLLYLVYHFFGLNPAVFRLVNIVLHLTNVLLVYSLLQILHKRSVAFLASAMFAVHPILTEAVGWISGGIYPQYSFFILLGFLCYVISSRKHNVFFASIVCFLAALSTSEKAIIFPFIPLLFELSYGNIKKQWKKVAVFFAITAIISLLYVQKLSDRISALETTIYHGSLGYENPILQIPIAVVTYLKLIFWPRALAFYQSEFSFDTVEFAMITAIFLIFTAYIVYAYIKSRHIFFWLCFFVMSLIPTLTPLRISWVVAERYVYLGSLGIFVSIALLIGFLNRDNKIRKALYIGLFFIIAGLMIRTAIRNNDWRNEDTLWIATANTSPSSPNNHNNLGNMYARNSEYTHAIEEFKLAILLHPNYAEAYYNMGNAYRQTGKIQDAITSYQKSLELYPQLWQALESLAGIAADQKQYVLAEDYIKKAQSINPLNTDLQTDLGNIMLLKGEKEKAENIYRKVLTINPEDRRARINLELLMNQ